MGFPCSMFGISEHRTAREETREAIFRWQSARQIRFDGM